jgi:hypothetical protein
MERINSDHKPSLKYECGANNDKGSSERQAYGFGLNKVNELPLQNVC